MQRVLARRKDGGKVCVAHDIMNDQLVVLKEMLLVTEDIYALLSEMYNCLRPLEHSSLMKYDLLFYIPEEMKLYATMVRKFKKTYK